MIFAGESGTYTVSLTDKNGKVLSNQNVRIVFNGKTSSQTTNSKGQASLTVSDLSAGHYDIASYFDGTSDYESSSASNDVVVFTKGTNNTQITADNFTMFYKGGKQVATVTDTNGNALKGATVKFIINGGTYKRTTNDNGQASFNLNINPGTFVIKSYFVGDSTHLPVYTENTVVIESTVSASDIVKYYKNATPYSANVKDSNGKYLASGTKVQFNINGMFYNRTVSGTQGLVKLNINLPPGDYILTVTNPSNGQNFASKIKVLTVMTDNKDITKYYRNGTQYGLKILDGQGNPVGAGEKVSFNINGMFYDRTTNSNGTAKLNINLPQGNYVITATYNGCSVSNKIKVLSVLNATNFTKSQGDSRPFIVHLRDGSGNAYANRTVKFNINGVFYDRITNSNGDARLNINLPSGKYIITSSYEGSNIANTVTIS